MIKKANGFTLTEVIITISLFLMLFIASSVTVIRGIRKPYESQAYDILVADIKNQQAKAFAGFGDQTIVFTANSYTLSPDNFVVNLPTGFEFTTSQQITFISGTGETSQTSIVLRDTQSGETKTINLNEYGTIY